MVQKVSKTKPLMATRFRGFMPVVIDIETAGLNPETDAILEIAAIILEFDNQGYLRIKDTHYAHVTPFDDANLNENALEFTGIDPYHPFRFAVSEQEALDTICKPINHELIKNGCNRAVLVGHNSFFDISFLQAAVKRTNYKSNPFHKFTTFDTATLAGLAYGHTVLAVAAKKAGIEFEVQHAHSALYDATKTAELFCDIVNRWKELSAIQIKEKPST